MLRMYRVFVVARPGLIYKEVGTRVETEEVEILGENEYRYCVNDDNFTTIEKKKSILSYQLNKPSINSHVNDSCWGSSIRYTLYSDKMKRRSTIKREIERFIDKKHGAFCNVDLSVLD